MTLPLPAATEERHPTSDAGEKRFLRLAATRGSGPVWDAEYELLFCVARKDLDPEAAVRIEALLQQPIRWDLVIDRAKRHGLVSFLYTHLNSRWPRAAPADALDQLQILSANVAKRNFFLAGKLCGLMELLATNDIPAVAYKGPALGLALYGDLAWRTSFDLDILIRKQAALQARQLLISEGFEPELRMTPRQESVYLESQGQYIFNRDSDKIHLELHWALTPSWLSTPLDLSTVWQNTCQVRIGFQTICVLPPEELLLALCVHGAKHVWDRLLLVCDLASLLRAHPELDWSRVLQRAEMSGSRRVLFLGLFLASEWLSAPVPSDILHKVLLDRMIPALAQEVAREYRSSPNISMARFYWFYLRARESGRDRFRVLSRHAFQPAPADWGTLPLPDPLFPFYYLVRPLRLGGKYTARPWRKIGKC